MLLFRWLIFIPSAVAASIAAYVVFGLVSYVVRIVNIVPQESVIDLILVVIGANFVAAAAGVLAGSFTAPKARNVIAILLAALSISFAIFMAVLAFLNPESISQSLFEVTLGSLAWIFGASSGAYGVLSALREGDSFTN